MPMLAKTAVHSDRNGRPVPPGRKLSESEFVNWCTGDTWAEWVNGEVNLMSPVSLPHEQNFTFLVYLLMAFVEERGLGIVLTEPFQIRLGPLQHRRSPDIFFIATKRMRILKTQHVEGPPDLIIEIVSPESEARDWREKYLEYQSAGVREYWVIDPMSEHLEAYALKGNRYDRIAPKDGKVRSIVLKGFFIKPIGLFGKTMPKVAAVLRELRGRT